MHPFDPFNAPKTHAVDVEFEAFPFDFVAVAKGRDVGSNELPTTINTNVILFTYVDSVFTDMR